MKVEEINKKYQEAKKDKLYANLDKLEKHQQDLEKQVKAQKRKYEDAQTKKTRAEEDKDDATVKQAEQEIKDAKEEMEKTKKQLEKQKETIAKVKGKVEQYIDEITKDPQMKAQIDKVIEGRAKKKIKELEDKKQNATNFKELLTKHPNIEAHIVGMIHSIDDGRVFLKEKERIEKLLESEKDPAKIAKLNSDLDDAKSGIAKAQTKFETNRSFILKCAEKSNIDISKDWLSEFVKYGSKAIAKGKNGKLDINKTLNNNIKLYDKEMKTYKTVINNLETSQVETRATAEPNTPAGVSNSAEAMRGNTAQDYLNFVDAGGERYLNLQEENQLPDTIRKPKWNWKHPFKSIKARMEYNKTQKETVENIEQPVQGNQGENNPEQNAPAPESHETESPEQTAASKAERNKQNREFRKALHYDIVQDYISKRTEDLQKEDFREPEEPENEGESEQDDETR